MQESWRWFGPDDPVSLENIVQAGASHVVSALHHIAVGDVWPIEEIQKRKQLIESAGLKWNVVESVPLHDDIKLARAGAEAYMEAYCQTLDNLSRCGVHTVCYNFMPVVDWTRTSLRYKLDNESYALHFSMDAFVAYDTYVLCRRNAEDSYSDAQLKSAKKYLEKMSQEEIDQLESNIIAGLPGGSDAYDRQSISALIEEFLECDEKQYQQNLFTFLKYVVPEAERLGVNLCIHPDDPPFSLFGLPRVVSTADDVRALFKASPSEANGLTLCAGSFGSRADNDLPAMAKEFGPRIHFVHLRNVQRDADGSFYESEHLKGDNDMYALAKVLLEEEQARRAAGRRDCEIAMRPDHGHLLGDDVHKKTNPGYSMLGRMKGLAELRGLIYGLNRSMSEQ